MTPMDIILTAAGGIIALLLAVVGMFLKGVLREIKTNTAAVVALSTKMTSIELEFKRLEIDVTQSRQLRLEFEMLKREFHLHLRRGNGAGNYVDADEEE